MTASPASGGDDLLNGGDGSQTRSTAARATTSWTAESASISFLVRRSRHALGPAGIDQLFGGDGDDTLDEGRPAISSTAAGIRFHRLPHLDLGPDRTARCARLQQRRCGRRQLRQHRGPDRLGLRRLPGGRCGANYLTSLGGDDYLAGVEGNDTLLGGAGNDQFWGGTGADYIDGSAGFDIARYDFAASGVVARLDGGAGGGEAAGAIPSSASRRALRLRLRRRAYWRCGRQRAGGARWG